MANNIDLSTAINNFQNAVYGKDVRDSLVEVAEAVQDVANNQVITLDTTLTESGKGADAKATGDAVNDLKSALNQFNEPICVDIIRPYSAGKISKNPVSLNVVKSGNIITLTRTGNCGFSIDGIIETGKKYKLAIKVSNLQQISLYIINSSGTTLEEPIHSKRCTANTIYLENITPQHTGYPYIYMSCDDTIVTLCLYDITDQSENIANSTFQKMDSSFIYNEKIANQVNTTEKALNNYVQAETVELIQNKLIKITGNVGDIATIEDVTDDGCVSAVVNCTGNEVYSITGIGGYSFNLITILDNNNEIILKYNPMSAGTPDVVNNYHFTTPEDAKKIYFASAVFDAYKTNKSVNCCFVKGNTVFDAINESVSSIWNRIKSPKLYNVCEFGVVPDSQSDQSQLIQSIIDGMEDYSILYFPRGGYLLNDNLVFTNKRISVIGDPFSVIDKDKDFNGSRLIFNVRKSCALMDFRTNDNKCIIKNIYVYSDNYTVTEDRTNISTGETPSDVYTVTSKGYNQTGIQLANYSSVVDNVIVRGCQTGISVGYYNTVMNSMFYECYQALTLANDNSIINVKGVCCEYFMKLFGGLNQVTQVRMDGVRYSGIQINGGGNNAFVNVNCDYAQEAIFELIDSSSNIISNISGRCGTLYNNFGIEDMETANLKKDCFVSFAGNSGNNYIQIASNERNPFDVASEYRVPLITFANEATGENNKIDCECTFRQIGQDGAMTRNDIDNLCYDENKAKTVICYRGRTYILDNNNVYINSVEELT